MNHLSWARLGSRMEERKTGKTGSRGKGNKIKAEGGKSGKAQRDGVAERRGSSQAVRVP